MFIKAALVHMHLLCCCKQRGWKENIPVEVKGLVGKGDIWKGDKRSKEWHSAAIQWQQVCLSFLSVLPPANMVSAVRSELICVRAVRGWERSTGWHSLFSEYFPQCDVISKSAAGNNFFWEYYWVWHWYSKDFVWYLQTLFLRGKGIIP